jgi:HSP20 family protein
MANIVRRRREERERGELMEPSPVWEPFRMMRDLLRWDPFRELEAFAPVGRGFVPSFDVSETKDAYLICADLPGVKEEDLEVSMTENRLQVSGRRDEQREQDEGERYYTYERSFGAFTRSFVLPPGADADNIHAELKDGVLRVTVGKRPEVQPRRIALGSGEKKEKGKA